jgi:hypothetical protein
VLRTVFFCYSNINLSCSYIERFCLMQRPLFEFCKIYVKKVLGEAAFLYDICKRGDL